MITRCLNIDWFEVYAVETGCARDAAYFMKAGFMVHERGYGTPMYRQMFTLEGVDGEPLLEIRRAPKSDIFDPFSCHIRLCNRTCYFSSAVDNLEQFMSKHGYRFQRISRVDLCLDFTLFDYGDDPQKFIQRYMEGRYAKMNQVNLTGHAKDAWNQRFWNSLSWGSQSSNVRTRLYNKTKELKEVKDKPYIRQAWYAAGLIDDWHLVTKDGNPVNVWRLEFEVKSGTKNWFQVETCHHEPNRIQSYRNDFDRYRTFDSRLAVFWWLVYHYFHFKHVEYLDGAAGSKDAKLQRKDRCKDKPLFRMNVVSVPYVLREEKVASSKPKTHQWEHLLKSLYRFRDEQTTDPRVYRACNYIIAKLEEHVRREDLATPWNPSEILLLRRLIAERIQMSDKPSCISLGDYEALTKLPDLFGEQVDEK